MTAPIATVTLNPAIDQTIEVPNFQPNAVNRSSGWQDDAGGKGVNVASFLATVGHQISVTGFLGRDNATPFDTLFLEKGIADHFIRLPGATRVNLKLVDDVQNQVTDINAPGLVPGAAAISQLRQTVTSLAKTCGWFILSGSVPTGVADSLYAELIRDLKALGKTVVLDTSGAPLTQGLAAKPDLIKPNQRELEDYLHTRLSSWDEIVAAARELIASGIPHVVVSLGAEGAIFVDQDRAVHAQPPEIAVKSTVGAGDAMVAGTVAGLISGQSLRDSAALATAFSMAALAQIGPRLPPIDDIRKLRDLVTVQRL